MPSNDPDNPELPLNSFIPLEPDGEQPASNLYEILSSFHKQASRPFADNDDVRIFRRQTDEIAGLIVKLYAKDAARFAREVEQNTTDTEFAREVRLAVERLIR